MFVRMGTTRLAIVFAGLLATAAAQQVVAFKRVGLGQPVAIVEVDLSWRARYEVPPASARGPRIPVAVEDRLVPVLRFLLSGNEQAAGGQGVSCVPTSTEPRLYVDHEGEQLAIVEQVAQQLALAKPLRARLHATVVCLPASLARERGLPVSKMVVWDESKMTQLLRDAVQNEGSIRNLPEVLAAPLTPFAIAVPAKPDTPSEQILRVRGEMVPVHAKEVALRLHVVRGALPVEPTCTPEQALLQAIVRLQVGQAVMVMAVEGDTATVLIVRCVELANAPLPKRDAR